MHLTQNLRGQSIYANSLYYSNTPFYFLIPEHAEKDVKRLSKKNTYLNQYETYYQYLFMLHTATSDYLAYTYDPNPWKPNYKGFDFNMDLWWQILKLRDINGVHFMLDDLYEVGLIKECTGKYIPEPDYRRINLKKNESLKFLKCPSQFLFLVNTMNSTFNKIYFPKCN